MNLILFRDRISKCWSADTKYSRSVDNVYLTKSRGQCWVTAIVARKVFGGDVVRGYVNREAHYWNILPDYEEVDFTSDQYGGDGINPITDFVYTVEEIPMSHPRVKLLYQRYLDEIRKDRDQSN